MEICENFDDMIKSKSIKTTHKVKSRDEDVKIILNKLHGLDIWTVHPNRTIDQKVTRTPYHFDITGFISTVDSTVKRLLRNLPQPIDSSDESDTEE